MKDHNPFFPRDNHNSHEHTNKIMKVKQHLQAKPTQSDRIPFNWCQRLWTASHLEGCWARRHNLSISRHSNDVKNKRCNRGHRGFHRMTRLFFGCNVPLFFMPPQKHIKTHALVLLRSILGSFFLAAKKSVYLRLQDGSTVKKKTCSIAAKPPFFIRVIHSDTPGQISGDHLATSGVCKFCKSRRPPRLGILANGAARPKLCFNITHRIHVCYIW